MKLLKGGELEGLLTDEEAHFLFPSVWAAQDAQMRYVRAGGAVVGEKFSTIGSLAERIYLLSGEDPLRLGPVGEILLLKRILLQEETSGVLYPGAGKAAVDVLLKAFHRAVRMLRHGAVSPEELEAISRRVRGSLAERISILRRIYLRYLEAMVELGATDEVGYLRGAARRAERLLSEGSLPGRYHLVGFYDISRAQAELLSGLLKGGARLTLYIKEGWNPFTEPLRLQFRRIEEATGVKIPLPLSTGDVRPSVRGVHSHPSVEAELKWAFGRVRRELRAGTPPSSMAIAVREVDTYLGQALLQAERYSIPLSVAPHEGLPLCTIPAVKLIMDLVRAAWLNSPREYVIPLLSSPLLQRWLGVREYPKLELMLRERGFEEGTAQLRRLLEEDESTEGALRLVEIIEELRGGGDLPGRVEILKRTVLELYRVLEGREGGGGWRVVGMEGLSKLHAELARASPHLKKDGGAEELYDLLDKITSLVRVSPLPFSPEGVALCSFREILPLGREKVFFLGLDQELVPAPFKGIPLLSPEEASWLNRALGREVFVTGENHLFQERFLLEAPLSGAGECWLSYRYLDGRERVNLPTPFITGILREHEAKRWSIKEALLPPVDEVEGPGELRLSLLKEVREGREVRGPGVEEIIKGVKKRSEGEIQRREGEALGVYDGVLRDEGVLSELSRWGTDERPLSSVTLEEYGTCPMRFFFRHILGVEPLPEVEAEPTPLTLGTIIHEVLQELFQDFSRVKDASGEELRELLRPLVEKNLCRFREETAHHLRRRLLNPKKGLVAFLEGHLKKMREGGRVPMGVEMEFEAKGERALKLPGGERVAVVGRVDRVDLSREELYVVDYKSGSSYGYRFLDSSHLQLPLYLNVLKELTGRRVGGGEYLFTTYPFRVTSSKPSKLYDDLERSLKYVEVYTRLIREGIFPPLPQDPLQWYTSREVLITPDPDRCRYCPYKDACRIAVSAGRVTLNASEGGGEGG